MCDLFDQRCHYISHNASCSVSLEVCYGPKEIVNFDFEFNHLPSSLMCKRSPQQPTTVEASILARWQHEQMGCQPRCLEVPRQVIVTVSKQQIRYLANYLYYWFHFASLHPPVCQAIGTKTPLTTDTLSN